MLATILTLRQLAHQVGERVKCDSGSTVVEATCLIAGASGATPDGGVCFPSEFFVMDGAFALGQDLNIRSLAYIADCCGELHPLNEATLADNDPRRRPLCRASWEQISRF
jgi:hypothetical protein